nr:unnamed protein product [Digitaria exilis]
MRAVDRYIMGGQRLDMGWEFQPTVGERTATRQLQNERPAAWASAGEEREESLEDLLASMVEVDVMWP